MTITWDDIDRWRAEKGMKKAELARLAGIPEATIYRGLNRGSNLQPSMKTVMRSVFPEKFTEQGEVRS